MNTNIKRRLYMKASLAACALVWPVCVGLLTPVIVLFGCFFFFKQKTAYEISELTGVQTCALPIYRASRSEEHTSELQSHSEISYAVFCLHGRKKINHIHSKTQHWMHNLMNDHELNV